MNGPVDSICVQSRESLDAVSKNTLTAVAILRYARITPERNVLDSGVSDIDLD